MVLSEYLRTRKTGRRVAGLKGEYFNTADQSGTPVFTRIDTQIDFAWGWRSPGESVAKHDYSVRWTGHIEAPVDGKYLIGVAVEDGWCRLFLDGSLRINLWGETGESFENRYASRSDTAEVNLKKGRSCDIRMEYAKRGNKASVRLEWIIPNSKEPIERAVSLAAQADVSIVFAGLSNQFEGGNNDREDLELPGEQADLIDAVCSANGNTVVVLINGTPLKMDPWIKKAGAVLEAWYPGQEGGTAIARILFGDVNPSGKLPDTFPRRLEDNPSHGNYPGTGETVRYEEGIFVGYRHYEKKRIQPLFPFGYGLSYTRFEYRDLAVSPARITAGEEFTVSVDVTNAGKARGKEVVQLYVGDAISTLERPIKELKAFRKIELEAGETEKASFLLDGSALSYYDPEEHRWAAEPGEFSITVGGSSCGGITGHLLLAEEPQ